MNIEILSNIEGVQQYNNVKSISYVGDGKLYGWNITTMPSTLDSMQQYYILDTVNQNAFSHWVYESAVFIPEYIELLKKYPRCKIAILEERAYKRLFFKYYSVPLDNICLFKDISDNNTCFFHQYISLNDPNIPKRFQMNILHYKELFSSIPHTKNIPFLYLPRGTKENLTGSNNRKYNVQPMLKEIIVSMGGVVYETDNTTDLCEQIAMVRSSKCIILDYGSSLWVNGLFASDSKIICLNLGWAQHRQFPSLEFIYNKILEKNILKEIFSIGQISPEKDGIPICSMPINLILKELKLALLE
jgi:hypothetical protein